MNSIKVKILIRVCLCCLMLAIVMGFVFSMGTLFCGGCMLGLGMLVFRGFGVLAIRSLLGLVGRRGRSLLLTRVHTKYDTYHPNN